MYLTYNSNTNISQLFGNIREKFLLLDDKNLEYF